MTNINLNLSLNATVNFNFEGGVQGTQAALIRQKKAVKATNNPQHVKRQQQDKNGRGTKSKLNTKNARDKSAAESSSQVDSCDADDDQEDDENSSSNNNTRRGSIKGTKSKKQPS